MPKQTWLNYSIQPVHIYVISYICIWLQISCSRLLSIRKSYQLCKVAHKFTISRSPNYKMCSYEIKMLALVDRLKTSEPVRNPAPSTDNPIIPSPSIYRWCKWVSKLATWIPLESSIVLRVHTNHKIIICNKIFRSFCRVSLSTQLTWPSHGGELVTQIDKVHMVKEWFGSCHQLSWVTVGGFEVWYSCSHTSCMEVILIASICHWC